MAGGQPRGLSVAGISPTSQGLLGAVADEMLLLRLATLDADAWRSRVATRHCAMR